MEPRPVKDAETRPSSAKHFFFWLGVIALSAIGFNTWLDYQANPNQSPEVVIGEDGAREVRLERNRSGHYVTSGSINGEPVVFMLDTGASDVSIPLSVAERIGLERGVPRAARTANGTIRVYDTRLDRVSIGGLSLTGVRGSINPHFEGEAILLGMSFLGELEFTQSQGVLTLRRVR